MGQGIQEWTKSNFWKPAFKKFEVIWSVVCTSSVIGKLTFGSYEKLLQK